MSRLRKLYWSVTNSCNLGCRYCYYNSGLESRVGGNKNPLDYPNILDDMAKTFGEIVFTGGEPLLFNGLFDLISFFKSKNRRVGVLTNATLLTKAVAKRMVAMQVDSVSVSLDSLDRKENDYLRGKTKHVMAGLKNILSVKNSGMKIEIMQTISKVNYGSIPELVSFCKKKNITLWLDPVEVNKKLCHLRSLDLKEMSTKQLMELEKQMLMWAQGNPVLEIYVKNCLLLIKGRKSGELFCPMGTSSFILDPDGNVYPCFLRKDILLGNIYKMSFEQILGSKLLEKKRKELQSGQCVKLGCVCMTISDNYR